MINTCAQTFDVEGKRSGGAKSASSMKRVAASWRAVVSELVATAMLLLVGCMACVPLEGAPQPLYAPLAFGFVVMINIQIFGPFSGAHMNPSVTLASVLWGRMSVLLGIAYVVAQCVGAIAGYGMLVAISPGLAAEGVCVTAPLVTLTAWQALGVEIVLTTTLNFLNCSVWDAVNADKVDSVPIKFGLAIAGLSLAGGPLTGASMNPARSLGPALWASRWDTHWVYWVGPLLGSVLPVVIYKYTWLNNNIHKSKEQSHA